LVLTSKPITHSVAESLGLTIASSDTPDVSVDQILWRLGFDLPSFSDDLERFSQRLGQFNEMLLRLGAVRSEEDREDVRAVGVNLFVSVEHFLEEVVAFDVWLLASDHFVETRFIYEKDAALQTVSQVLGAQTKSGDEILRWDPRGGNTLGGLLAYLERAVQWTRTLLVSDRRQAERSPEDLPHYAGDRIRRFPFRHRQLWADCDPVELAAFVEGFENVAVQMARANVASVRNGLDHKREPKRFPDVDTMLLCAARLREALTSASVNRYIPKTYWLHEETRDQYGRFKYLLLDHAAKPLLLYGPSLTRGSKRPIFKTPMIIPAGNLLGLPNGDLIFMVRAQSKYMEYWANYPRRRRITTHSGEATIAEDSEDEL